MTYGSTSRNISILSVALVLAAIAGVFYFTFSLQNISITILSFYTLNILGNWMTLHRYYAHRSFEFKNKFLTILFTVIAILCGRGSPLGWTYIHRQHHKYSDRDGDPHSPRILGYKLFGFGHYKNMESQDMKLFLVKDILNHYQLFIHKYYMLLLLPMLLLLGVLNIELLYFSWIVPAFLVHVSQNNFNYFGHTLGYRNFDTKDNSKNVMLLFPIILGEAWHNNHHADPGRCTTKTKKFEFDPLSVLIFYIGTINNARS